MGNSYCCDFLEKADQFPIQIEIMVEKDEMKNNNNNLNLNNDYYMKKATSNRTPKSQEESYIINPLPEIVTIKRKKNKSRKKQL